MVESSIKGKYECMPEKTSIKNSFNSFLFPSNSMASTLISCLFFFVCFCSSINPIAAAAEPIPGTVGSNKEAIYFMYGTEKADYPWTCKCDPSGMSAALQVFKKDHWQDIPWNTTAPSQIYCLATKYLALCDPINDATTLKMRFCWTLIAILFLFL